MFRTVPVSDGRVHSSVRLWLRLEGFMALLVATKRSLSIGCSDGDSPDIVVGDACRASLIPIARSMPVSRTLSATSATARSTPSELQNVTKRNLSLKVKGPRCANTLFSGRSSGSQIAL